MNQKLNIITNNFKKEIWTPLWKFLTADRLLRNLHKQFIQLSRIKQKMNHHAEIEIASMMKIQTKSVMITPLTQIWQNFKYKYVLDVFWSQPIKYVMKIKVNTILILIIILQKLDFGTKKVWWKSKQNPLTRMWYDKVSNISSISEFSFSFEIMSKYRNTTSHLPPFSNKILVC